MAIRRIKNRTYFSGIGWILICTSAISALAFLMSLTEYLDVLHFGSDDRSNPEWMMVKSSLFAVSFAVLGVLLIKASNRYPKVNPDGQGG